MKFTAALTIAAFVCVGCQPAAKIAKDKKFQETVGKAIIVGGAKGASEEAGKDVYHFLKDEEKEEKKSWWPFGKE